MTPAALEHARGGLAADARSLDALKLRAGQDSAGALKEAARQFESLFMRELVKSMREATMKSGLLDSPGGDLSADMLDQQLALQMSGLPGGLSEQIARQLAQRINTAAPSAAAPAPGTPGTPATRPVAPASTTWLQPDTHQGTFVQRHAAAAERVARDSGIPAAFMLGQAGHETGWGRSEIRLADGSPSFNLFGIKASAGWSGKVAEVTTTEYVNGVAQKVVARFRAYDSYEDSLRDYARLITQSPRYAQLSARTDSVQDWAAGLQRAGYATDPDYASKLSRAINATLQLQRARTI